MGDPEIDAMSAVASSLGDLEPEARERVLRWAAARYQVAMPVGRGPGAIGGVPASGDVLEDANGAEVPTYQHFAELFAKAQPKSDADKALVAGYWLQAIQGQGTWQSAALQKELKNLGHAVSNITTAMTSNISTKPQRIIQLQKSGNSKQARKTYKVTHEGLEYVKSLLRGKAS